jgi:predicted acetyltransferase
MEFLRLPREQNILTKPLYEEVFPEDKGAFSDYYYQEVATGSTIYAARQAPEDICSMVHLNPTRLLWSGEQITVPYIVAVATRKEFRHRGLMRSLLDMIFGDLEAEGVPFAFLMPVNEAIYKPFGFERTWSWQWEEDVLCGKTEGDRNYAEAASLSDGEMASFADRANRALSRRFELFTERSLSYYRRLEKEQRASGGELRILMENGRPAAAVQTAREAYPPMMCRIMNREAYERHLRSASDTPFRHAYVCEVV